jgi:SAM-dependent methyltransferase
MENILNGYKIFNLDPAKLRHKDFFKNMQDYADHLLTKYKDLPKKETDFVCPLCSSNSGSHYLSKSNYSLFECLSCGLISPNVSFEDIKDDVYDDPEYVRNVELEILSTYEYRKNQYAPERLYYILQNATGLNESNLRLLDLGCGPGYFLGHLQQKGINYKGLELAKFLVDICKQKGLNVSDSMLEDEPDSAYNTITLFDVLEHLKDPVDLFKSLNAKLEKGGYVLAYTPNIHSLAYHLMREDQTTLAPYQHLGFYNEKSLEYLAKKTGFSIHNIDYYGLDIMDYFYMKSFQDGVNYNEKLIDFASIMQAVVDKQKLSNHMRIFFKKL